MNFHLTTEQVIYTAVLYILQMNLSESYLVSVNCGPGFHSM